MAAVDHAAWEQRDAKVRQCGRQIMLDTPARLALELEHRMGTDGVLAVLAVAWH